MTLWQESEIKSALKNQLIQAIKINKINQVIIDSRIKSDNGLFIAINGLNNDGHNFLQQSFDNGCVAAIVDKIPQDFINQDGLIDKKLILVQNTLLALDSLAVFSRNRTKAKIIAITGSVGKTSVKDMLGEVFSTQGKTFATEGNLNNNIGLPLSLANMPADSKFGIFEMGMNHLGEIKSLSKMTKPHIAIVTNIFAAHIGNFKNEEEIALAKSEIFSGLIDSGFILINADSKHYQFLISQASKTQIKSDNIITFGNNKNSDIRLLKIKQFDSLTCEINVMINKSQQISYLINSINQITIFNSLIIVACLSLIGNNLTRGLSVLKNITPPQGRGNLINIKKNGIKYIIIDDSYNANSASMQTGLKFLSDLKNQQLSLTKQSRSIAFIGNMLELGKFSQKEHKAIANYISDYNIDQVILVGDLLEDLITAIAPKKLIGYFHNSSLAAQEFQPQDGDIIFVKGSRAMKMERIISKLSS